MKRKRMRGAQCVKKKKETIERDKPKLQRNTAVLLVELCGFFGQALQHTKMLTLHIVSQKNPNYCHLSALKPCTLSTYKTNHTYPIIGKETQKGWGIRKGKKAS